MSLFSLLCKIHEETVRFSVLCKIHEESCKIPQKFIISTLAFHPLSSSTPVVIPSLHGHEGNECFLLPLIGVRHATAQSWEFLVCPRNKSDSWIIIWLCKSQCLGILLRCCHQNRKKVKFYSEWSLNNSWKLQPPAYNLFTKNLFEESCLGEFCATLMFAKVTL